jgi:hypothetical protein
MSGSDQRSDLNATSSSDNSFGSVRVPFFATSVMGFLLL